MSMLAKVITLGCPKNIVDSEQILGHLVRMGLAPVEDVARAEIILVNTCGFIEKAKVESIETILELAQYKKKGECRFLIVSGCLVQKYIDELAEALPEVDLFLGTGDIHLLPQLLGSLEKGGALRQVGNPNNYLFDDLVPRVAANVKHYAYVKIAEGCDNCCTYCAIPSMRGSYRSRTVESIVQEVKSLTEQGVKEIILVAQDTTLYGIDRYKALMLPQLLRELADIPQNFWIRLLYCYPDHITEELLQVMTEKKKICSYLDIPLQHSTDKILGAMGRPMTNEGIRKLLKTIRSYIPEISLRSTFIVGFPGETEEEFNQLLAFLREEHFDRAGFFTYSPEPGTKAAELTGQVPEEIKEDRYQRALEVQQAILADKQAQLIGKYLEVIVDGPSLDYEGLWEGRTKGDAPEIDGVVYFLPTLERAPGDIINIRITHSQDFALMGEICNEPG